MQVCKKYKEHFIEALYGDLSADELRSLHDHLDKCTECRKEFDQMQNTIRQINKDNAPEPGEHFWDNYWTKLDQRMAEENIKIEKIVDSKNIFPLNQNIRKWAFRILNAAAMLLIGIGIGYLYFGNPDFVNGPINRQVPIQTVAYSQETAHYLESSKVLLLGFVNFDTDKIDPTTMDFSHQQQAAKSLIRQAAVLKDDLKGKDNQRVLALIQQLEIILLQISNCEKEFDIPAIEIIKSGVDNNALLMKINLEEIICSVSEENNQSTNNESPKKKIQEL